jgi:hypothetical protein
LLFLVLLKDGREEFACRLTLQRIRALAELFLSLTVRLKEMRKKTLIVCSVLVVCL